MNPPVPTKSAAPIERRRWIGALGASSAGLLIRPTRVRAQSTGETLRVAGPPTEDLTGLYYAIKTGMFTKAGLDVELIPTSSGAAATTAVIAGSYEIAKSNLLALISAHLRGIAVVVVAPENMYSPRYPLALLQIAADATFKTGVDLNGRTAGVPSLNDTGSLLICAWVDKNGGNWRSLKFVEIPNSAIEGALMQHRVDIGVMQSPQLDASLAAGTTKTIGDGMAAVAPSYMYAGFFARRDWAAAHNEQLRRFNRVLSEAHGYVNTHLTETAPLVAELTKVSLANTSKMHRSLNATSLDPALVQPFIDAAAKYGIISRSVSAREIFWTPT